MKYFLLVASIVFFACHPSKKTTSTNNDGKIQLTIVQVNDVYEIAPIMNGRLGGLARIATIKQQEIKNNPNTLLVMAGDFLSPSVYNSLKYENKRIRGRQMVDAMNAAKFDLAVFGNHEFDITFSELQERLNESDFKWVSSNTFHKEGGNIVPFKVNNDPVRQKYVVTIKDGDGTTAKIGFFGITLPTTTAGYVHYDDPLFTAKKIYDELKDSCDAVIALTHQAIKDDSILATEIPSLPVIIGGHEHDMRFKKIGNVYITKAHANATSAYIIKLNIDKKAGSVSVEYPKLKSLDSSVALDATTSAVVKKWTDRASRNYASLGFDAAEIIIATGDSLEGREIYTRDTTTNLTELIIRSMQFAVPDADVVINNSGSIRVDDVLYPPVSQFDILRALPFGGSIREVDMKGELLQQLMRASAANKGTGGYLHHSPVEHIDPSRTYHVAIADFLLTGGEANMGFLTINNPLVTKVYPVVTSPADPRSDIRLAIVKYLTK